MSSKIDIAMDSRTSRKVMNGDEVLTLYGFLHENTVNGRLQRGAVMNAILKFRVSQSPITHSVKKIREANYHLNVV